MRATDADDPTTANGELRYSLVQDQGAFQIDSITGASFYLLLQQRCPLFLFTVSSSQISVGLCHVGVISCKVSTLDRERRNQYVVVVKAQDMRGMSSGSTATTSVSITIIDINDNLASFVQSRELSLCVGSVDDVVFVRFLFLNILHLLPGSYELQVPENHRVREKIGTLELEDKDQIQNKEPIFSLPEDISRLFSVERSPTKDANLMLNKVRCKNHTIANNGVFTFAPFENTTATN